MRWILILKSFKSKFIAHKYRVNHAQNVAQILRQATRIWKDARRYAKHCGSRKGLQVVAAVPIITWVEKIYNFHLQWGKVLLLPGRRLLLALHLCIHWMMRMHQLVSTTDPVPCSPGRVQRLGIPWPWMILSYSIQGSYLCTQTLSKISMASADFLFQASTNSEGCDYVPNFSLIFFLDCMGRP
jgi:hypothetical protein